MSDRDDKIVRLQSALDKATPARKKTPRRKADAPAGNVIYVNGDGVAAGQIAGGDIHNHVSERKIVRNTVVRGPGYITSAGARKIQGRIKTLVDMGVSAGGDEKKLYAKWHSMLKNYFSVPSYLEIPASQEQHAIDWLQKQKVMLRPSIRRTDNQAWRNDHYRGIWAHAKKLGISKASVHLIAEELTGKQVTSLKQLGERNLKALYERVMRLK